MTSNSSLTNSTRAPVFNKEKGILALIIVWQNTPSLFIVIICLYFLLIIIGIILNSLVCYVMIKSKRYLKNISCFFITHMAAVDLFGRVIITPMVVYMSLPTESAKSPVPCKISTFVSSSCAAAIFGSLVVIAIDRYRNIIHPLSSLKRKKRPFLVGVLIWVYAILSSVMFLYTAQNVSLDDLPEGKGIDRVGNPTSCDIKPGYIGGLSVTISAIITFVVPLLIIIITYTAIFVSLRRRAQSGLVHKVAAKSKAKAARMLVLVVIGFVVFLGPIIVVQTIRSYGFLAHTDKYVLAAVIVIADAFELCSSLFNPIIYSFYSDDFKKDMIKICGFCKIKHTCFSEKENGRTKTTSTTTSFQK